MCRATAQCRADHLGHPRAPERLHHRPDREAPRPPRHLRRERLRRPVLARRQVARADAHRPAQRARVAHDREPAVVGHLQPLVPVRRPAVRRLEPRRQPPELRRRPRPEPEGPVDMHPGALRPRQRDQLGERIERPAHHVPRLQAHHHRPLEPVQHPRQRLRPHPPLAVRLGHMHALRPEAEQPQAQVHRRMRLAARAPPAPRAPRTARAPRRPSPARPSSAPRAAASAVKFAIVAPVVKPTPASRGSPSRSSTQPGRHLLRRRGGRRRIGEGRVLPPGRGQPVGRHPGRMRRPDHPAMEARVHHAERSRPRPGAPARPRPRPPAGRAPAPARRSAPAPRA